MVVDGQREWLGDQVLTASSVHQDELVFADNSKIEVVVAEEETLRLHTGLCHPDQPVCGRLVSDSIKLEHVVILFLHLFTSILLLEIIQSLLTTLHDLHE